MVFFSQSLLKKNDQKSEKSKFSEVNPLSQNFGLRSASFLKNHEKKGSKIIKKGVKNHQKMVKNHQKRVKNDQKSTKTTKNVIFNWGQKRSKKGPFSVFPRILAGRGSKKGPFYQFWWKNTCNWGSKWSFPQERPRKISRALLRKPNFRSLFPTKIDRFTKNGQKWQKMVKNDKKWQKMTKNWSKKGSKIVKIDENLDLKIDEKWPLEENLAYRSTL